MKIKSAVLKILNDKTGASLALVLGIMLMLMAAGVSVLIAAEAGAGTAANQRQYNQILLLDSSVHKNILHSLQSDPEDDELLSRQLVMAIFNASLLSGGSGLGNVELDIDVSGVDLSSGSVTVEPVELSFPVQNVGVISYGAPAIDPDIPRVPTIISVSAQMDVTVRISTSERTIKTISRYKYSGGVLSDAVSEGNMDFEPDGYGEWELVKYEKAD